MVANEQVNNLVEMVYRIVQQSFAGNHLRKYTLGNHSIDLVAASTKFFRSKLISLWVAIVVTPNLLMAIEAKRNAVVRFVRAASRFIDDVSRFNICSALFSA